MKSEVNSDTDYYWKQVQYSHIFQNLEELSFLYLSLQATMSHPAT